jgi:hemerythrin HHE cation binding domain-containing protein
MALRNRVEYLRKEHKGLLELADRVEAALALANRKEFPDHEKSLAELRVLEHRFSGIVEHCHAEERIVESTFHHYLGERARSRIDMQHREILRALGEFRGDLRFATVDRMKETGVTGSEVVTKLREHIAGESKLLDRIIRQSVPGQKHKACKKPCRALHAARRHRTHTAIGRSQKERPNIPYTMELHPEL